jgi:hypothetical protein
MANERQYTNEYESNSKRGFSEKVRKLEKEGFGGRVSPTGYTDCMMGMDDLDKIRRVKLNNTIND